MEFTKIQITRQGTLNVNYKNADGDVIQFLGANIVHKDLKEAMQALVPHLAIITEQREAFNKTLSNLRDQRITDEGDNVYKRLTVDAISLGNGEQRVAITGTRILTMQGVISVTTPNVTIVDSDDYEYSDDLSLDLDAVKYEVKQYIEEKKWGVKQAEIDFKDIQPFDGVEADEAPVVEMQPKKRGRKSKKTA